MSERKPMSDADLADVLRHAIEAEGPDYHIHDGVLIARDHLKELSSRHEALRAKVEDYEQRGMEKLDGLRVVSVFGPKDPGFFSILTDKVRVALLGPAKAEGGGG